MPKFDRLIRISVRVVTGLLALGLLGYSIFHAGPSNGQDSSSTRDFRDINSAYINDSIAQRVRQAACFC